MSSRAIGEDDAEWSAARKVVREAACARGLDVFGPCSSVRRTSSRICLSVEHGDYNGTDLFGLATDRFLWFAHRRYRRPNSPQVVRLFSANFPEDGLVEFDPQDPPSRRQPSTSWAHFAHGVWHVLKTRGVCDLSWSVDGVLYGNIPGGGMSRSASLTLNLLLTAMGAGVGSAGDLPAGVTPMGVVDLAVAVENEFVGSPCGNLDQVMILFSKAGHGTLFSPGNKSVQHVPFGGGPEDLMVAVMDTGTKRKGLETCKYVVRAKECREAAAKIGVEKLAQVRKESELAAALLKLGGPEHPLAKRLRYVHGAQERLERMLDAWRRGDAREVGSLMRQDGIGLRDLYEISGPELEAMCDIARTVPGVYGERMLGGGEKGASGLVCHPDAVPVVRQAIATSYPRGHPDYADLWAFHPCRMVDGVVVLPALSPVP